MMKSGRMECIQKRATHYSICVVYGSTALHISKWTNVPESTEHTEHEYA